ncbi:DNA cytosine methyltransferase [Tissierella carlieri]|uniref:DNA (cytosine-5-)-methyltransferase n=1 Tax=Tissierella carlieri TaxID=689904 RepID=A0ABT1SFE1_9FIRM|nr:DNA cytosine methyltransferase [Tissierella carlieri]MCQ4924990.1 DNA cytosine methyltransferase [Tissierella carlieri]
MEELIIDNFCGGGGTSKGIKMATGRCVDVAINHDEIAIKMHKTNHPYTKHYIEDIYDVDPLEVTKGRPVALAWFSPACNHYSRARGGKPVDNKVRGLAWVVVKWALLTRPRVNMLENVEEFQTWGPLKIDEKGRPYPDISKMGITFKGFIAILTKGIKDNSVLEECCAFLDIDLNSEQADTLRKGLGYKLEYRPLRACDYGAPTTRKRFFMVARCDGKPIVWPEPTHGDPEQIEARLGILKPWRTAAECIDWSIPCPSIFETSEEIKKRYGIDAKRPLAENTLKRIARGFQKFVIDNPSPFIVRIGQTGLAGDGLQYELDSPLTTITTKAEHCLVTPYPSCYDTETTDNEVRGQALEEPLATIPTNNRFELITAFIARQFKSSTGHKLDEPLGTITTVDKSNLVMAFLMKYYGSDIGQRLDEPLHTITTKDRFGLVIIKGEYYRIVDIGIRMLQPSELFKAQGFPGDYIIDRDYTGKRYPKTAQTHNVGNSVSPVLPKALVEANLPELCEENLREVI